MAVMMRRSTMDPVPLGEYVPTADQRIVLSGVSWDAFETFLTLRGDQRPRVTYLNGTLELMSPSKDHESIKKRFATVVEAYLNHARITYEGVGSWLLKHAPEEAGLEPDECYILHDITKQRPDLAIEVVWTSGGINKLEVFRRLGIPEVWFWINDTISVHVLTGIAYETRRVSACLPDFDFALVIEMLSLGSLSDVYRVLHARLPIAT